MAPACRAPPPPGHSVGLSVPKQTGVKWVCLTCHNLLMCGALDCRGEGCLHMTRTITIFLRKWPR